MPAAADDGHAAAAAARQVVTAVARWRMAHPPGVLAVAIDGHGAAGKSTIADMVAGATGAALVRMDDFFTGPPAPAACSPPRSPGPAGIAGYYDWRRVRAEALEPLAAGHAATFREFDPDRGRRGSTVTVRPAPLILLEGVSSAAPALADLVHRSVFVDTPPDQRIRRLRCRVKPEEWDDDWLAAEEAYFAHLRPPASFDLVVPGADQEILR